MEAMAGDGLRNLVHCGRQLRDLLALQGSCRTGTYAVRKFSGVLVAISDALTNYDQGVVGEILPGAPNLPSSASVISPPTPFFFVATVPTYAVCEHRIAALPSCTGFADRADGFRKDSARLINIDMWIVFATLNRPSVAVPFFVCN